jgi:hypothetical protein
MRLAMPQTKLSLFDTVCGSSMRSWQLVVAKQFLSKTASLVFGFISASLLQTGHHFFDKVIEAFRHNSS